MQVVIAVLVLVKRVQTVAGVNARQRGATGDVRPMRARSRGDDDARDASGGGLGGNCRRVVEPVEVAMAVGVGKGHGFGACWEQWAVRLRANPTPGFLSSVGRGF